MAGACTSNPPRRAGTVRCRVRSTWPNRPKRRRVSRVTSVTPGSPGACTSIPARRAGTVRCRVRSPWANRPMRRSVSRVTAATPGSLRSRLTQPARRVLVRQFPQGEPAPSGAGCVQCGQTARCAEVSRVSRPQHPAAYAAGSHSRLAGCLYVKSRKASRHRQVPGAFNVRKSPDAPKCLAYHGRNTRQLTQPAHTAGSPGACTSIPQGEPAPSGAGCVPCGQTARCAEVSRVSRPQHPAAYAAGSRTRLAGCLYVKSRKASRHRQVPGACTSNPARRAGTVRCRMRSTWANRPMLRSVPRITAVTPGSLRSRLTQPARRVLYVKSIAIQFGQPVFRRNIAMKLAPRN